VPARVPVTLVTGFLGSGKTTLLRHILTEAPQRMALIVNEFGELAIDSRILEGKNVRMAELAGGCVCCSLVSEFEAAVDEIIESVHPDRIIVETTGVAEPEALLFNIQEDLPQIRLDGVITIVDADAMIRYPQLGHTTRLQIEAADLLLLNKSDLVHADQLERIRGTLTGVNARAPIVVTEYCKVDPDLLFGLGRTAPAAPPSHVHQPDFQSFYYRSDKMFDVDMLNVLAEELADKGVYRAKGLVRSPDGGCLFNYVAGRWEVEPFATQATELVFIGKHIAEHKGEILAAFGQASASRQASQRLAKPS
jgi:G3E family GTPase